MSHDKAAALIAVGMLLLIATPTIQAAVSAAEPVNNPFGEKRLLVIPVDFSDNQSAVGVSTIESRMAFVDSYIGTASYNQTSISYEVFPRWIQLNGTFASYTYTIGECPNLAREAIGAVEPSLNLSDYRYVMIIHSGYNFDEMRSEYIGSNCASVYPEVINLAIASVGDQATTWVHELLHSLGGYIPGHYSQVPRVQDLYEERLVYLNVNDNIYVDGWDIMSSGTGGMTAWTRMELGWIPKSEIQTASMWSNDPVNLTSLDAPGAGTKALMIPISSQPLSLTNGSSIAAWSYYIVEFRTPVGIDKNLTNGRPVVLVTMINETKYFDSQSGPLLLEASLYVQLGSVPSFSDNRLNLTVSVLNQGHQSALVLLSREGGQTGYVKAVEKLDGVLGSLATEARLAPFMGASLSLAAAQRDSSLALSALARGNVSEAVVLTDSAAAAQSQAESSLTWLYEAPFFIADAVALTVVIALVVFRRPAAEHTRYYALRGRIAMAAVLISAPLAIAAAAIYQADGASNIGYAIVNGSNSYLSDGWWSLLEGTVFWVLFMVAAFRLLRRTEFDIKEETEEEEQPGQPGDIQGS